MDFKLQTPIQQNVVNIYVEYMLLPTVRSEENRSVQPTLQTVEQSSALNVRL